MAYKEKVEIRQEEILRAKKENEIMRDELDNEKKELLEEIEYVQEEHQKLK